MPCCFKRYWKRLKSGGAGVGSESVGMANFFCPQGSAEPGAAAAGAARTALPGSKSSEAAPAAELFRSCLGPIDRRAQGEVVSALWYLCANRQRIAQPAGVTCRHHIAPLDDRGTASGGAFRCRLVVP